MSMYARREVSQLEQAIDTFEQGAVLPLQVAIGDPCWWRETTRFARTSVLFLEKTCGVWRVSAVVAPGCTGLRSLQFASVFCDSLSPRSHSPQPLVRKSVPIASG